MPLKFLDKSDISLSARLEVEEIAVQKGVPIENIRYRANHAADRWEAVNFNGASETMIACCCVATSGTWG